MKLELIKEEISSLLENLTEQFQTIQQYPTHIPQIEIDIVLRNIQKVYEASLALNKVNGLPAAPTKAVQKGMIDGSKMIEVVREEIPVKTHIIEEKVNGFIHDIAPKAKIDTTMAEPVAETNRLKQNPVEEILVTPFITNPNEGIQPAILKKETQLEFVSMLDEVVEKTKVEPDLFSSVKASKEISDLNNKLAEARNTHSIVEKLQSKRIENLKSVIGINDKFYFINELFAGDARKYEDVIYTLNNFKKFDDAMQYFSTLKYRFNWDELSAPYEKLVKMLERKFDLANA